MRAVVIYSPLFFFTLFTAFYMKGRYYIMSIKSIIFIGAFGLHVAANACRFKALKEENENLKETLEHLKDIASY